jgi:hypothetical protein
MPLGSDGAGLRVLQAFQRAGQQITLRLVREYSGADLAGLGLPVPLAAAARTKNPPSLVLPTISRAAAIGATTVTVAAAQAEGLIAAGDKVRVVGHATWLTVAAPALAAASANPLELPTPGFVLSLAAAVPADLPAGPTLAVEFAWSADTPVWARIHDFPLGVIDGERILTGDLRAGIPAYGLPRAPAIGDRILVDGGSGPVDAEIVNVRATRLPGGAFSHFDIQAR